MKEKMTADIPIVLTGAAPGLRSAGRYLTHPINTITVESFPDRLPPEVIIDLDQLYNLDDAIYVHQIDLGPDVTILTDSEQLVARISEVSAAKIEHELVEAEVESTEEAIEEAAEEPTPGVAEAVTEEKPEV
jgi:large subunit ribosomal protein L25